MLSFHMAGRKHVKEAALISYRMIAKVKFSDQWLNAWTDVLEESCAIASSVVIFTGNTPRNI